MLCSAHSVEIQRVRCSDLLSMLVNFLYWQKGLDLRSPEHFWFPIQELGPAV